MRHRINVPVTISLIGSSAIVILYLLLAVMQSTRPLHLDNMDFPAVASATSRIGLPLYYRGEEEPIKLGLYHPPLYIYTLAGWFKVFGDSPMSARVFGAFCAILSAIITTKLVHRLYGTRYVIVFAPVFLLIFLVNPFAIQVFGIADIDPTVLTILFLLFIYACVRVVYRNDDSRLLYEYISIFLVTLLCFWSKLTTTLLLPFVGTMVLSLRFGFLGAAWRSAALFVAAATVFIIGYYAYGVLFELDTSYTFSFLLSTFVTKTSGSGGVGTVMKLTHNILALGSWGLWVPLGLAAVASGIAMARAATRAENWQRAFLLSCIFLTAASVFLGYSLIALPFGGAPFKYVVPAWPLISMMAAGLVVAGGSILSPVKPTHIVVLVGGLAAGFVYGYWFLQDKPILNSSLTPASWLALPALATIATAASYYWISGTFRSMRKAFSVVVVAVFITNLGQALGVAAYQVGARYSTDYDYGQTGMLRTSSWLRRHTDENDVIMSMKDIGYLSGRRYLENYTYVYGDEAKTRTLGQRVKELHINYFIFTTAHGQDSLTFNRLLYQWITEHAVPIAHFGDYVIYEAKIHN